VSYRRVRPVQVSSNASGVTGYSGPNRLDSGSRMLHRSGTGALFELTSADLDLPQVALVLV